MKLILPFNSDQQIRAVIANYNLYIKDELNLKVNVNDLKENKVVFDPREVIDEKENEKVKSIFKYNLQIDLEDIETANLFRLRTATFLIKFIVMIRRFVKSKDDPNYHYSSFILRHLGIVDMLDSQLSQQSHNPNGASFSGTDAEGVVIDESNIKQSTLTSLIFKSVYNKIVNNIKSKFSFSNNGKAKQAASK